MYKNVFCHLLEQGMVLIGMCLFILYHWVFIWIKINLYLLMGVKKVRISCNIQYMYNFR